MRLRIAFSKHGKVRFTSHRDVARIWERALRRSELPVAYSEGFNPRPKLSFGLALSTGHESNGEYIDVDLDPARVADLDIDSLAGLLTTHLPVGLTATGVVVVDRRMPSLQQAVTSLPGRSTSVTSTLSSSRRRSIGSSAVTRSPLHASAKARRSPMTFDPQC